MAKGIREFNQKLSSLGNTMKMTKTMKMVSASKLRKAQDAQRNSQAYAQRVNDLIARLASALDASDHPLLTPREGKKKAQVVIFTSDKGLCGAFNNHMIRHVSNWLAEHEDEFEELRLSFCGRRGFAYFNKRRAVHEHYEDVTTTPAFADAAHIAHELMEGFENETFDEVYLAYNIFHSPLSQTPTVQKLLPIEAAEFATKPIEAEAVDYIFEPPREELLEELIPKTVKFKIYYALLENAAGEHGARMTAMDNATTNCDKMIDHYTLMRNRARQAAITTELIEIISGAEAL